jgi:hypothetical protein
LIAPAPSTPCVTSTPTLRSFDFFTSMPDETFFHDHRQLEIRRHALARLRGGDHCRQSLHPVASRQILCAQGRCVRSARQQRRVLCT